jgi:hypothetical protein
VASLSCSDTEEELELLPLSPAHGLHSPLSGLHSSSGSDLFDDWPGANDMVASVYVALSADASSSHASMASAPYCTQKSFADGSSAQQSHTRASLTRKPWRRKPAFTSVPQRTFFADGSSTQNSRTQATLTQKPQRLKSAFTSALQRKSKKMKVDAECAFATLVSRGGSLCAADFDKSAWEIMYPLFVEEGLVAPSECVRWKYD